jgi:glycosyltransferase involved in cell wall biosynthesis
VLYLTNNPNPGSSMRVFLDWFLLGRSQGLESYVVAQQEGNLTRCLREMGVEHRLSALPWPSRKWPFPSLWHAWKVARWARQRRIDIIHCVEHDIYPFCLLVQKLLRRPLLVHCHYLVGREFCSWAFGGNRLPEALVWTTRTQRDACLSATQGIIPESRQHHIYIGVSLDRFGRMAPQRDVFRRELGLQPDDLVIGTASAIAPRKRIHEFVELVRRQAATNPKVVGLIAGRALPGNEAYLEQVKQLIAATGLGDRLRWLGRLEPLEPFLHALDVFVSASEYETFGMSVCEAMACSRTVVAYEGGSVTEVVGDAGLIVPTGDFEGLCAGVRSVLEDAALRRLLGEQARLRVGEVFDPAISFQQMRQLYETILARRGGDKAGAIPVERPIPACAGRLERTPGNE